jgi:PhnB protein
MKLQTYLNYGGNCEEALRFYEQHLGGKIESIMRFGEMPDQSQVPAGAKDMVVHARLALGGTVLLASDNPQGNFQPMRSAYLTLTLDRVEEAESVYKLLTDGGEIFMPMAETFFAARFAMLRDRFGTSWMLLCDKPRA